jgi:hypothetical protein
MKNPNFNLKFKSSFSGQTPLVRVQVSIVSPQQETAEPHQQLPPPPGLNMSQLVGHCPLVESNCQLPSSLLYSRRANVNSSSGVIVPALCCFTPMTATCVRLLLEPTPTARPLPQYPAGQVCHPFLSLASAEHSSCRHHPFSIAKP